MPDTEPASFRDSLATIDKRGRRLWVYPHKPSGRFYRGRTILSVFLLAFYVAAPFVRVGGNPLLLFDILNRRFFVFGLPVFPHDFHLVVLAVIAFVVFVILFTAAFGRLFCGWVCPQTVFMEMVFRRIEYWLEGDGPEQRKRDRGPWTGGKAIRKVAKYAIFLVLSFSLGNILLAYFIGSERLLQYVTSSPAEHPAGFAFVVIFTLVTFGIFARFREQVCTLVCPYGRLQSVLLDSNSIVVAYDFERGETRGKLKKGKPAPGHGDCVDCGRCVMVCPTGIDIRNGTQLECVNCTACIDACDQIMTRVGLPLGLIRYASYDQIAHQKRFRFTGRLKAYSVAFAALVAVIIMLGAGRGGVETTILRTTGSLYEQLESGAIRNLYTVKVLNKSSRRHEYTLRLKKPEGELRVVGPALVAAARSSAESVFTVEIRPEHLFAANTTLVIEVLANDEVIEAVRTRFNAPEPSWPR
jgi:cytochrome c oxidase accessory protein FixG